MHICIIANKYPTAHDPSILVFVQQLAWELADQGAKVTVVSPIAINLNLGYRDVPVEYIEKTMAGSQVRVYRPKYIGFGQSHLLFGKSPVGLTAKAMEKSVRKVFYTLNDKPDVVIGHFAAPAGVVAARIAREFGARSYLSFGDSSMRFVDQFGRERIKKEFESLSGVIAVSSEGRESLIQAGIVSPQIVKVFPNGYNPARFYKKDKKLARNAMGFPTDVFLVGYVGWFNERKGIKRLENAIDRLCGVKFVCAGKGNLKPESEACLFAESVSNDRLNDFYNAVDIFALPTLREGCCNAIIEAMACGLPIVSSDRSFNFDILDETCSILVDPNNEAAIAEAIAALASDPCRVESLSEGSLTKAKELRLDARARRILAFVSGL